MNAPLRPVVVLGAARSGTKILRDALSVATGVPAVPYDVGYVWRHGNEGAPDDCQVPAEVTPRTRRLVRAFLARYADHEGRVIEKTVGNTLRIPYVAELVPDAMFVHVVRHGADVAESARREWQRPAEWDYLARKARHFPLRLLPGYGRKFVWGNTIGRRRQGGTHVPTWGPRYPGIDEDLERDGLLAVTARQWRSCVEAARRDLWAVDCRADIRYEDLVEDPHATLQGVADALGWHVAPADLDRAAHMVRPGHAGAGRARLTDEELSLVDAELGDLLKELGHEQP